ncbi:MAG TPA: pyridoxal-dependent decarboxylase [Cryptosporangiaceae bacterium]|nr:pyridoxal-dependent decarboxylase [Cryptosporangiaceae bacterium]
MTGNMTPEEFRRYGRMVVDWVADYWEGIEKHPVLSQVAPGDVAGRLPARAPEQGEPFEAMFADLDRTVLPGITHWQHPSFFGYFPTNTSGPSVLADLAAGGLGVQGMLWATSPACTEIETVALDWLRDLLGLPDRFSAAGAGGGVIQDTASSATLVATLTALHRASGGCWNADGLVDRYAVYASTEAHSSVQKAARIAGLGDGSVRLVDVDPRTLAMRPDRLRELIGTDRAAGVVPALVVATIGTTSTTAIDPVPAIADCCADEGIWLHVDAAYAGSAAVCPELRWTHTGVDRADSYCFNPHKWLLVGFDCDAFWVADRAELIQALSVLPEYLRNAATESGAVIDYRDWQVQLGRRFRALKLWWVMRWYGAEGLRAHIRRHVAWAQDFAGWVQADGRFEVAAPHPFGLVCFRLRARDGEREDAADERNATLLRRLNESGALYLTHTKINGRYTLRFALGAPTTERRHVEAAWQQITTEADRLD